MASIRTILVAVLANLRKSVTAPGSISELARAYRCVDPKTRSRTSSSETIDVLYNKSRVRWQWYHCIVLFPQTSPQNIYFRNTVGQPLLLAYAISCSPFSKRSIALLNASIIPSYIIPLPRNIPVKIADRISRANRFWFSTCGAKSETMSSNPVRFANTGSNHE